MKFKMLSMTLLVLMSCVTTTYSAQQRIPWTKRRKQPLPTFDQFVALTPEIRFHVFEEYIGSAESVSELYDLVLNWKMSGKIFLEIAEDRNGRKLILKREYDIVNSIKELCYQPESLKSFYGDRLEELYAYIESINQNPRLPSDPVKRAELMNKIDEKLALNRLDIQNRIKKLKVIVSEMIADFGSYAPGNNLWLLVSKLLDNGANPNYQTTNQYMNLKPEPVGPALRDGIFGIDEVIITYLDNNVLGGKTLQLPLLELNLKLLKLLLDGGANPNQIPKGKTTTYIQDIIDVWTKNNTRPFSSNDEAQYINTYCELVFDLLLSKGAKIAPQSAAFVNRLKRKEGMQQEAGTAKRGKK